MSGGGAAVTVSVSHSTPVTSLSVTSHSVSVIPQVTTSNIPSPTQVTAHTSLNIPSPSQVTTHTLLNIPSPSHVTTHTSSNIPGPSRATSNFHVPSSPLPDPFVISDDSSSPSPSPSPSPVPSPTFYGRTKLSIIKEMFPKLTTEQEASVLFDLFSNDPHQVIQFLLEGLPVSSLLNQLRQNKLICPPKVIVIRPDHIVEDALRMLYKGEFNVSAPVEIDMVGVPAVDLGGVRRQFYTTLLREMPIKLRLFETNGLVHFPTGHTDALLGGHYRRLGQIIVHSVVQEGPGFPYLPKSIYYYLVGGIDLAVTHLCIEELPSATQYVVEQV